MLRSYILIVLIFSLLSISCEVNQYIHDNDQLTNINTIKEKAAKHYRAKEYKEAEKYYDQALELANYLNIKNRQADFTLNKGVIYYKTAQYKKSIQAFEKTIELYIQLEDKYKLGLSLSYLGQAFNKLQIHENALTAFLEAAILFEQIDNEKKLASTYSLIGIEYKWLDMYELSIEYHKKALNIRNKLGNQKLIARSTHNLANTYLILKDYDKALVFFQKALEMKKHLKKKKLLSITYERLGRLYTNMGNLGKAKENYLLAYKLRKDAKDFVGLIESANDLGKLYIKLNDLKKSELYLDIAKNLAVKNKNYEGLLESHKYGLEVAKKEKDNKEALYHFKEIERLQKHIIEEEKERNIISQKSKFLLAEFQVKMVSHQLKMNKRKKQNKGILYISSLGLIMTIGFVLISRGSKENFLKVSGLSKGRKESENSNKYLNETFKSIDDNFNTIIDLLHYERVDYHTTENEICNRIQHRLDVMYYVHNRVCVEVDEQVKCEILTNELISFIITNLRISLPLESELKLKLNIANSYINPLIAIPLGLVLNELISEILKFAFLNIENPELTIDVYNSNQNQLCFDLNYKGEKIPDKSNNIVMKKMLNQLNTELKFEIVSEERQKVSFEI